MPNKYSRSGCDEIIAYSSNCWPACKKYLPSVNKRASFWVMIVVPEMMQYESSLGLSPPDSTTAYRLNHRIQKWMHDVHRTHLYIRWNLVATSISKILSIRAKMFKKCTLILSGHYISIQFVRFFDHELTKSRQTRSRVYFVTCHRRQRHGMYYGTNEKRSTDRGMKVCRLDPL